MRGEYEKTNHKGWCPRELPPRARRILVAFPLVTRLMGTTSACAENTPACGRGIASARNYLRVRGEYFLLSSRCAVRVELPPRARRIPAAKWLGTTMIGTTSACAENTWARAGRELKPRNYLRVRGEYLFVTYALKTCMELPPRARRIRELHNLAR